MEILYSTAAVSTFPIHQILLFKIQKFLIVQAYSKVELFILVKIIKFYFCKIIY